MTIFAILLPRPQPGLTAKIVDVFKSDALAISDTQYLVSASGTALEISVVLGIYDPTKPSEPSVGDAIVFATSGYFGRAPTNIWEWIRVKLEAPPRAAASG